jgi:MEMO1 family protein
VRKYAIICSMFFFGFASALFAGEVRQPYAAGQFYPASKEELSATIASLLGGAGTTPVKGLQGKKIIALISPHAGYAFSGGCAAEGYTLIRGKNYTTVVVIGPSHRYGFHGVSVYPAGAFRTPLGDIPIDEGFTTEIADAGLIRFDPAAFAQEHSVEVELPFLQTVLGDFRLVPVVMGDCSFEDCQTFAARLTQAIGARENVLVVASTDLYHGYDYEQADSVDSATLSRVKEMDAQGLYRGLVKGELQMCGGYCVVTTLLLAKSLGHSDSFLLQHTNSCRVTRNMQKGIWTVGYASVAIDSDSENGGAPMQLTIEQKKRLLSIARQTIESYLKTGKRPEIAEDDPLLKKELGAFVTLHERGELRGCIGSLTGSQPLYLTIRDMAIEAATGDPRFSPVRPAELKDIEIEISVLSPMEKVDSTEKIKLGVHGVVVRRGYNSGVFLPQVATETGWSKEEFLSCLCSQKAGLPADAWKDKSTDLFCFTATVFSEKEMLK